MKHRVFLIHGWSVQETTTYGALHARLADHGFDLRDVHLGRYVSLENVVEIRDIAKALHRALDANLGSKWTEPFHIVTHSTGALVAKQWIVHHYKDRYAAGRPLRNVIFLAAPHFGSRLAHHGRSMLAQAAYRGDPGRQVLTALELGSSFSWEIHDAWLDPSHWSKKGIRPFNLIGDRVGRDPFKSRIFPAGYEHGSDGVVRVPAGNLNFSRFELSAATSKLRRIGSIEDVPFGALAKYTHSGPGHGIMGSIRAGSTPSNHASLRWILECLRVETAADYVRVRDLLARETARTRRRKPGFAQFDFRFRDDQGGPIHDYVFKLGMVVRGRDRASSAVVHIHKNEVQPNHFTVFVNPAKLDPQAPHFIEIDSGSDSELFAYQPDPFRVAATRRGISEIIRADRTTQIEVVLSRVPSKNLFVFHAGDDPDLHVSWNRKGEIVKTRLE